MRRMERLLIHGKSKIGYTPSEFINWKNGFNPSVHGYMLAHDLFQHQPTDQGFWVDELRAIGASYVVQFEKGWENGPNHPFPVRDIEELMRRVIPKSKAYKPVQDADLSQMPPAIERWFNENMSPEHAAYFGSEWQKGFLYGTTINLAAFRKIANATDEFVGLYKNGCNVIVNTDTGDIQPVVKPIIPLTPES